MTPEELSDAVVRKRESTSIVEPSPDVRVKREGFIDGNEFSIASFACFFLGIVLTVTGFPRTAWPVWFAGIAAAVISVFFAERRGVAAVALLLNIVILPFPYWVYFPG